jgi:hypothetical protein
MRSSIIIIHLHPFTNININAIDLYLSCVCIAQPLPMACVSLYPRTCVFIYIPTYDMYVYVACIPPVTGPGEDATPLYMYHTRWYICEDKRPQAPQHGQQHGVSIAVSLMRSTLERDPPSRFRRAPIA